LQHAQTHMCPATNGGLNALPAIHHPAHSSSVIP